MISSDEQMQLPLKVPEIFSLSMWCFQSKQSVPSNDEHTHMSVNKFAAKRCYLCTSSPVCSQKTDPCALVQALYPLPEFVELLTMNHFLTAECYKRQLQKKKRLCQGRIHLITETCHIPTACHMLFIKFNLMAAQYKQVMSHGICTAKPQNSIH